MPENIYLKMNFILKFQNIFNRSSKHHSQHIISSKIFAWHWKHSIVIQLQKYLKFENSLHSSAAWWEANHGLLRSEDLNSTTQVYSLQSEYGTYGTVQYIYSTSVTLQFNVGGLRVKTWMMSAWTNRHLTWHITYQIQFSDTVKSDFTMWHAYVEWKQGFCPDSEHRPNLHSSPLL